MRRDVRSGDLPTRWAGERQHLRIVARNYESVSHESHEFGVRLARAPTTHAAPVTTRTGSTVTAPSDYRGGSVTGRPQPTTVLVLARESVLAALIGMLLELEDYKPVFAEPGERPEDAIRRLRPPLIVMLDSELDAANSDLFYARAAAAGARVVLFN